MSEKLGKIPQSPPEVIEEHFEYICNNLMLEETDFGANMSVCDVGSGGNEFVAGAKRKGYKAFIMGIESHPERYEPADPTWICATADDARFPSEHAEQFDLVISHEAFPKYLVISAYGKDVVERYRAVAPHDSYSYEGISDSVTPRETHARMVASLAELYRMTKPGGRIKLFPVEKFAMTPDGSTLPSLESIVLKSMEEHLGVTYTFFEPPRDPADTEESVENESFGVEIRKPLQPLTTGQAKI